MFPDVATSLIGRPDFLIADLITLRAPSFVYGTFRMNWGSGGLGVLVLAGGRDEGAGPSGDMKHLASRAMMTETSS